MEKQLTKMREHLSDLVKTAADCNTLIDLLMDPERSYSLTVSRLQTLTTSAEYLRQEVHRLENLIQEARDPREHEAVPGNVAPSAAEVVAAADAALEESKTPLEGWTGSGPTGADADEPEAS